MIDEAEDHFSVRLARAVDLWMGELARAGRAESTRTATAGT